MVEMVWHSQTKERANGEHELRPKPARQSSTLLMSGEGKRVIGHASRHRAPPPLYCWPKKISLLGAKKSLLAQASRPAVHIESSCNHLKS